MSHGLRPCLLTALLLTGAVIGLAADIPETKSPITVDGMVEDEEWREAKVMRLVQLVPVAGANASEQSEVLLMHDGEALYAAARFADSEPELIRANNLKRDETSGDDQYEGQDRRNDGEAVGGAGARHRVRFIRES